MTKDTGNFSLHPGHLDDLRRSGLSTETIKKAGVHSVRPMDFNKILGSTISRKTLSVLAFPYPFCDGFVRYKLFPPAKTRNGTIRYFQPPGTGNRLYFPIGVESGLTDFTVDLYITEGEKKALKACQEGLCCVATGGLWSWSDGSENKNLISDFDRITLEGRTVYIVPDNDWQQPDHHGERKNLHQAVYELGLKLIDKGARVFIIELPQGPEKIGLDDFLCQHPVDEFHSLPKRPIRKQTIEEMIQGASLENLRDILKRLAVLPETERAIHVNSLAKKLNIPKRSILKDIETLSRKTNETPDIERLLEAGANPESRYSAQNYINGVLSFGAILGSQRVLVRSDGEVLIADGSNNDFFRFKRCKLTAEAIKRFRAGEDIDGRDLLNRIQTLFVDHVIFRDPRIPTLLAVWVLGTYFFKVFQYYGYLWVNSPIKRCGKSLLLDILSQLCFNSTSRLVDPSSSFLFREVDCNDGTLVLDEIEGLGGGDKEQKSELISLLNAGFQRGSQTPRMESRNREFVVSYFNAYSPKALAGIKSVVDTIEDRSFKIPMVRKKKTEIVRRFNLRVLDSTLEKIREDCFLWALRYAGEVAEIYGGEQESEFLGIETFDDRLKDILEPLLSIASVIDAQVDDKAISTVQTLIVLAQVMGQGREDQESLTGSIPAVVNLMKEIIDGGERFISADDLFSKFQADDDLGFVQSKRSLAFFLAKLDLHRASSRWIDGRAVRGYTITKAWLDDLGARYA